MLSISQLGKSAKTKISIFRFGILKSQCISVCNDYNNGCRSDQEQYYQVRTNTLAALKSCIISRNLEEGRQVHLKATKNGHASNIFVSSSLITMYSKCGSMAEARRVFNRMPSHNLVTWNSLILGYAENGEEQRALELFGSMQRLNEGCQPDGRSLVAVLKAYASLASIETGNAKRKILLLQEVVALHFKATTSGSFDIFVASALVSTYAKFDCLVNARRVFDRMPVHSIVCWNSLILGYVEDGKPELGLEVYEDLRLANASSAADALTYAAALKGCTYLVEGCKVDGKLAKQLDEALLRRCRAIQREVEASNFQLDGFVASALVCFHAKLGNMTDSQSVFDQLRFPDVVSWNSLLVGYVENGEASKALELFAKMDCKPNPSTFVAALKACTTLAAAAENSCGKRRLGRRTILEKCSSLHAQAASFGYDLEMFVASTLIDCYSKCGNVSEARKVFDRMACKDVVSWTALILGYAENGEGEIALEIFAAMELVCEPDTLTYVAALKACSSLAQNEEGRLVEGRFLKMGSLQQGREIHFQAARRKLDTNSVFRNTLVDFYANCGDMVEARRAFDGMDSHTVVSWTALILGYAENGDWETALKLFEVMRKSRSCLPNSRTFVAALKACGCAAAKEEGKRSVDGRVLKAEALERGMRIHSQAAECGCDSNVFFSNTLLYFYAKCGSIEAVRELFETMQQRDTVSWTVLLLGYVEMQEYEEVLELFARMQRDDDQVSADCLTYVAAFKACAALGSREDGVDHDGKLVKVQSLERGFSAHALAESSCGKEIMATNTLIDMYAKCGSLEDARRVFDRMFHHTIVTWNALITGYVESGEGELGLELLQWMRASGCCSPDARTYAAALKACSNFISLQTGKEVHAGICRSGFEVDAVLETCLVEFYGRCGSMAEAQHVFDGSSSMNLRKDSSTTWSVLITGYSRQGDTSRVFNLLQLMEDAGVQRDASVLVSVLIACSRAGLVNQGKACFEAMQAKHGVVPGVEHYNCIVDLLGRANRLNEAVEMAKRIPFEAVSVAWNTVLGACCKWKNVEVGKIAFERLMRIDGGKDDGAAYVLMANLYAANEEEEKEVMTIIQGKEA